MSLYRFKSRETGDLVMLQPHGRRILEVIGKDPARAGVLEPGQMPGAILALQNAAAADEAKQQRLQEEARARGELPPEFDPVSLRMRSAPFIDMLERCMKADVDVVWGV